MSRFCALQPGEPRQPFSNRFMFSRKDDPSSSVTPGIRLRSSHPRGLAQRRIDGRLPAAVGQVINTLAVVHHADCFPRASNQPVLDPIAQMTTPGERRASCSDGRVASMEVRDGASDAGPTGSGIGHPNSWGSAGRRGPRMEASAYGLERGVPALGVGRRSTARRRPACSALSARAPV